MTSEPQRWCTPLLWFLLLACVVCLWCTLLPESFWLDETVTAFVLRHGAGDPSLAAGPRLDQTVYYWLPRASTALLGFSEFSARLPSLLATLVSLALLARIAARLIDSNAAWVAVFLCFVPHEFTRQATDARPYGFGACVALAAAWLLIRWLDTAGWRRAMAFAACAALLLRVHLIYWPFYAVFLCYGLARFAKRDTPVSGRSLAAVSAAVVLLLAPLVPVTLALFRDERAHVVTPLPGLSSILTGFEIPTLAAVALAGWLLSRLLHWPRQRVAISVSTAALLLAWWLWQPLFLLIVSWITGNSLFLPRYFSLALPGMILIGVSLLSVFVPRRGWRPLAVALASGILAVHLAKQFPPSRHSHWREAAAEVNELTRGAATPVICPSPFVEARSPVWTPEYPLPGFLYAHLDAYPIRSKPLLLPVALEPAGTRYARTIVTSAIVPAGRFVIYGGGYGVNHWAPWFTAQPELSNYSHWLMGTFGDVEVVLYKVRTR